MKRRYRAGTLVLETEFHTATGRAVVIDFMPPVGDSNLVRMVGRPFRQRDFRTELVMRFNYGASVPWVNRLLDGALSAIAGPERLVLRTPAALFGEDLNTIGEFTAEECVVPFVLSHGSSFEEMPAPIDAAGALKRTEAFWRDWSDRCPDVGPWTKTVKRSLITLKGLTYAPQAGSSLRPPPRCRSTRAA